MSWRSRTARDLVGTVRSALPAAALVAAIAVDQDGCSVELGDDCPPDGRFEIGSPTKTMTGAVLASLVDDGIVAFDDEIGRWLPAGANADITLVQLATHTSGLPRLSPGHVTGAGFRSMIGLHPPSRRAVCLLVNDRDARGIARAVRQALDAG